MSIYKIPLNYKAGPYRYDELDIDEKDENLSLDYNTKHQMMSYTVPVYNNKARIYTIARELIPNGLTTVYNDCGKLDKVELADTEHTRLIYRRFQDIKASEESILAFVKKQANKICSEIIRKIDKNQTLARLFFGTFYDGEAVEIVVKTATEEELNAVINKHGQSPDTVDNCGNYPKENMILLDDEPLAVMLMCTDCDLQCTLFDMAAAAVEEQIKDCIYNKVNRADDFQFITETGD